MSPQVLLLELNEVNFDYVRFYSDRGSLPRLSRLIDSHGISLTVSEQSYEEIEPWIQWVTAHTGLAYGDHRVFRLGDIVKHDIGQIWEFLEGRGLRVGAITPMNAKNRTQNAAFFMPDPWTSTRLTGGALARHLYAAVAQAVNDNASARLTPLSSAWLLCGLARYARFSNYKRYAALATGTSGRPWFKAMFLDLLLGDVFLRETRRTQPHFASLFLNAAAHIQHHYMFNSPAYEGELRNPEWYIGRGEDPVGQVYELYDRLIGQIQDSFPTARLLIATGLHQDPHPKVTFYWRLKDHDAFLSKLGVAFDRVEPRMSRDFLVQCRSNAEAAEAQRVLESAKAESGEPLFEVDNRGQDLFVIFSWPHDISSDFTYKTDTGPFQGLRDDVAFVAIKNGQHNPFGYFIDTGSKPDELPGTFPLTELPARVCAALGVEWEQHLTPRVA